MGKKDWCSKKGLKARERGMNKKESKKAKIVICVFYAFALVVFLIFGAFSAERLNNANAIDADFEIVNVQDALEKMARSGRLLQNDGDDLASALSDFAQAMDAIGEALEDSTGETILDIAEQVQESEQQSQQNQAQLMARIEGYTEFQAGQGIAYNELALKAVNPRDLDWKLMNPGLPPYTYFHPRQKPEIHAYDTCAMPMFWPGTNYDLEEFASIRLEIEELCADNPDGCGTFGTGWSLQWKLKVAVYWLGVINYVVLLFGVKFWMARFVGTICNCCLCCFNFLVILLSLVIIGLPSGRACNFNLAPVNYEGDGYWDTSRSYSDEYKIITAITIISFGLCCIQLCTFIPFFKTPYKSKDSDSSSSDSDKEKKERKKAEKAAKKGEVQTNVAQGHAME